MVHVEILVVYILVRESYNPFFYEVPQTLVALRLRGGLFLVCFALREGLFRQIRFGTLVYKEIYRQEGDGNVGKKNDSSRYGICF